MDASNLREQARKLRDAADKLDAAADVLAGMKGSGATHGETGSAERERKQRRRKRKGSGRLKELQQLLRTEGPMYRREILAKSKIPVGSVGMLLKEKHGFAKQDDGRWGVKDA
jgi:hypothetical protein